MPLKHPQLPLLHSGYLPQNHGFAHIIKYNGKPDSHILKDAIG